VEITSSSITHNVGDTYSIQLSPAKPEHAGYYRMVAENIKGRCEYTTLIHVLPLAIRSLQQQKARARRQWSSVERKRVVDEVMTGSGSAGYPNFPSPIKKSTTQPPFTSVGSDSEGYAPSQYEWRSSARAMSASTHPTYQANQYQSAQEQRSPSSSAFSGDAPHFVQTLISCVCAVGDEARFEAIVVGHPQPEVTWSKDGVDFNQVLALGSPIEFLTAEDGRATLVFRRVRPEDAGKYMCSAKNSSGVATSSAQLVIKARTEAPDFSKRLVSEEVAEGERIQWTVEVSGDPPPTVTWLRDGQLVPNCEEVRLFQPDASTQPNLYSMVIARVELADAGQFTCLLENSAGEARSTADLLVRPVGTEPGNFYHLTKVMQEKQVRGEELSRNQTLSIEPLPPAASPSSPQPQQ